MLSYHWAMLYISHLLLTESNKFSQHPTRYRSFRQQSSQPITLRTDTDKVASYESQQWNKIGLLYNALEPNKSMHYKNTEMWFCPSLTLIISTPMGRHQNNRVITSRYHCPNFQYEPFDAYCYHTSEYTAIKNPVPDRVKPSFVIFDIWALWRSVLSVRVPRC